MSMDYAEVMTVEEAAEMLRVSASSLRARIARGEFAEAVIHIGKRRKRFNRDKLRAAVGLA